MIVEHLTFKGLKSHLTEQDNLRFKILSDDKLEKYVNTQILMGAQCKKYISEDGKEIYKLTTGNTVEVCTSEGIRTNKDKSYTFSFSNESYNTLDISQLDTSCITTMSYFFDSAKIKDLILYNLDTQNTLAITGMFSCFHGNIHGLETLHFKNCKYFDKMFAYADIKNGIDLANLKITSYKCSEQIFDHCNTPFIKIKQLNTNNKTVFRGVLCENIEIEKLVLEGIQYDDWINPLNEAHIHVNAQNIVML